MSALFAEGQVMRNLEISRVPSQEVVRSIVIWRLFLVAMEVEGDGYRRSSESFEFEPNSFWIKYDSSLTGFGLCPRRKRFFFEMGGYGEV